MYYFRSPIRDLSDDVIDIVADNAMKMTSPLTVSDLPAGWSDLRVDENATATADGAPATRLTSTLRQRRKMARRRVQLVAELLDGAEALPQAFT